METKYSTSFSSVCVFSCNDAVHESLTGWAGIKKKKRVQSVDERDDDDDNDTPPHWSS